ncbi:hypothetical protein [Streptomyces sp. NPDC088812]|uniref:hypothetical protein n=1 Tax=Streptomyces sp. NPDC088812 TaxID=3365905 RepID=UPI00381A4A6C
MAEQFTADTVAIREAARIQGQLTDLAGTCVREFVSAAARTAGWVGQDDSMARELGPRDEKERHGTEETGASLMEAIINMAGALDVNGGVIQNAQDDANEAIDDHASKTGRH